MISSRGAHHKPVLYVALLVETTRYHFGVAGLAHLSSPSEFGAQISPRKLPSVGTNNWRGRQVTKEMGLCKERHLSAREILLARAVSRGGRAIRDTSRYVRCAWTSACCVLRAACRRGRRENAAGLARLFGLLCRAPVKGQGRGRRQWAQRGPQ